MSIILLIASIAFSNCLPTDLGSVCHSDLDGNRVYAVEVTHESGTIPGIKEALFIERFEDRTENASFRPNPADNGLTIIEETWTIAPAIPVDEILPVPVIRDSEYLFSLWYSRIYPN